MLSAMGFINPYLNNYESKIDDKLLGGDYHRSDRICTELDLVQPDCIRRDMGEIPKWHSTYSRLDNVARSFARTNSLVRNRIIDYRTKTHRLEKCDEVHLALMDCFSCSGYGGRCDLGQHGVAIRFGSCR